MKKSPVSPKYETNDYQGNEYDPHADFSQFLEEAKHHAGKTMTKSSSEKPEEEDAGKGKQQQEKKKKKVWKVLLSPWWKGDQKSKPKPEMESYTNSPVSNTKQRLLSSPVYISGKVTDGKPRRTTSGPITGFFSTSKKADNDQIPYVSLKKRGGSCATKTYGPIYLVT
ncbi:hypothetical protein UlMin_012127 [Ulmus minor]